MPGPNTWTSKPSIFSSWHFFITEQLKSSILGDSRMSRITHFELGAKDPKRAMDFYGKVFGWKFQRWEGGEVEYWLATTGEDQDMGINGAIMPYLEGTPQMVTTIGVRDIDKVAKEIERNGGKIIQPKMLVGTMGHVAYFTDTEGVMMGIFEPSEESMRLARERMRK